MTQKSILGIFIVLGLASCEALDKEEDIPSYIHIEDIEFKNTNTSLYGYAGSNITDAWVYADGDFLGVYALPCDVPVLASGETELEIGPGIKVNGIGATRAINPFYYNWESTVTLHPDSTVVIEPKVSYHNGTNIAWLEEFEDSSVSLDTNSYSDVAFERYKLPATDPTYESYVGMAKVYADAPGLKVLTKSTYTLSAYGIGVYAELDYSCNQQLVLSVIEDPEDDSQTETIMIYLNATTNGSTPVWNHLYLDLTDVVGDSDADDFGFGITAYHDSNNDTGYFYMDNLKFIYR